MFLDQGQSRRMCSFKRSRGNRVEQGGSGVSDTGQSRRSDHIRPNPTKSDQNQTGKKRIKMEGSSGNARKPRRTQMVRCARWHCGKEGRDSEHALRVAVIKCLTVRYLGCGGPAPFSIRQPDGYQRQRSDRVPAGSSVSNLPRLSCLWTGLPRAAPAFAGMLWAIVFRAFSPWRQGLPASPAGAAYLATTHRNLCPAALNRQVEIAALALVPPADWGVIGSFGSTSLLPPGAGPA
jgi:hypothetical protein